MIYEMKLPPIILVLLLFSVSALSNEGNHSSPLQPSGREIRGTISDAGTGEALVGATVTIRGAGSTGTVSGNDGRFRLMVPEGLDTLVISYVGYRTQEVVLGVRETVDVWLIASVSELDEVVVTAVGIEANRRALGYSVEEVGRK